MENRAAHPHQVFPGVPPSHPARSLYSDGSEMYQRVCCTCLLAFLKLFVIEGFHTAAKAMFFFRMPD